MNAILARIKTNAKNNIKDKISVEDIIIAINDMAFEWVYNKIYCNLGDIFSDHNGVKDRLLQMMLAKYRGIIEDLPSDFLCDCIWLGIINTISVSRFYCIKNYYNPMYATNIGSIKYKNLLIHALLIKNPRYIIDHYATFCRYAFPNTIIHYVKSDIPKKPALKLLDFYYATSKVYQECNITPTLDDICTMITNHPTNIHDALILTKFNNDILYHFLQQWHKRDKYESNDHLDFSAIYTSLHQKCYEEFNKPKLDITVFLSKNVDFIPDDRVIDYIIDIQDKSILQILTEHGVALNNNQIYSMLGFHRKFAETYIINKNIPVNIQTLHLALVCAYKKRSRYDMANIKLFGYHKAVKFVLDYKILPNDECFDLAIKYNDKRMLQMFVNNNFLLEERHIKKLYDNDIYPEELYNPDLTEHDYFRMFVCDIHHNTHQAFPKDLQDQIHLRELFSLCKYKEARKFMVAHKLKPDRYCADMIASKFTGLACELKNDYKLMAMSNITGLRHCMNMPKLFEICKVNNINAEYMCKKIDL